MATALNYDQLSPIQRRILSGFADLELNQATQAAMAATAARARALPGIAQIAPDAAGPAADRATTSDSNYMPTRSRSEGCPENIGGNVKVNQNCLNISDPDLSGRAQTQNETAIAFDPLGTNHLLASFNDYRRGDGNCYGAYSVDRGQTWSDTTIPMSFTRGTTFGGVQRQYWQSGGDTAVAWDTRGNAYFQCMVFNRGGPPLTNNPDVSSAVYVFRSTQNLGASWNFPGRPAVELSTTNPAILEDKPYFTVDNSFGSPFRDRVYVSWTEFLADGTAYIWLAYSNDYAEHFSTPMLVSGDSPLCVNTYGLATPHGRCNENQFSQPFTGPDGALYVTWVNYNNAVTPPDNRNQILLAKSTDGGNTFSAPVKVADYYDLPDCQTYQGQDLGRACVPEKGPTTNSFFRASNYPSAGVNPTNPSQVVVTFGSYINTHSNEANGCVPQGFSLATGQNLYTGVKTPGACNNDILLSVSNDAGATFTGTTTDPRKLLSLTQERRQATTDQFWQWAAFTRDGRLAVSYYDRQYGTDETTGYSDVSLSGSRDLSVFGTTRVTSSSNPPPTQFSGLFMGDYTGLTAPDRAFPIWSDTRNLNLILCPGTGTPGVPPATCTAPAINARNANDQDIFTQGMEVPTR